MCGQILTFYWVGEIDAILHFSTIMYYCIMETSVTWIFLSYCCFACRLFLIFLIFYKPNSLSYFSI